MQNTPSRQRSYRSGPMNDLTLASSARIVRQPGSTLHFASFDPDTATGDPINASAFRKLSLKEELCRPKRVVVETTPTGRSTWRFIPNARKEQGVDGEGEWPRPVYVCGELRTLTQDEWDMYKLDRDFDCLIRLAPNYTTVTRRAPPPTFMPPPTVEESPSKVRVRKFKRRLSENVAARRLSGSNAEGQRKKNRPPIHEVYQSSSSEEEDEDDGLEEREVSGMVVDEEPFPKRQSMSERLKKVRANKEEARKKRREATAKRREKMGLDEAEDDDDENMMSWTESSPIRPARPQTTSSPFAKRKVECFSDDDAAINDESDSSKPRFKPYEWVGSTKRTRTVSPIATRRAVEIKRNKRGMNRKEELERRAKARAEALHESVLRELYEEAARSQTTTPVDATSGTSTEPSIGTSPEPNVWTTTEPNMWTTTEPSIGTSTEPVNGTSTGPYSSSSQSSAQYSQETLVDEEAQRQAAIEESKRKIAELEKDKHIWEEQARKRRAQEAEEKDRAEAARKARSKQDSAAGPDREKEKEDEKRRAAEAERSAREAATAEVRRKRNLAREAAQKDARAWASRGWNARRALERYMALCDAFDAMNFLKGDVIVFESVPWPVLARPGSFGVEDINWTTVETFFRQVRTYLPSPEFRKLVEKSHRRFHPDRWSSRRVLQCIEDDEERECLEVAANTVAQALTPLWQEVTGR